MNNSFGSRARFDNALQKANEEAWCCIGLFDGVWYALNTGPVNFFSATDNAEIQKRFRGCETRVAPWSSNYPPIRERAR